MRGARAKTSDDHDGTEFREWYQSRSGLTIVREDETHAEHEEGARSEDGRGVHAVGKSSKV